jgi:hypothetical protein
VIKLSSRFRWARFPTRLLQIFFVVRDEGKLLFYYFTLWILKAYFIKFGTVNNIKQLQKEGLVYCNTLKYFSTLKDFVQGDELETAWLIDNSKNSIFEITPLDSPARKPLNFKFSKLIGNRTDPFGNLFCLYALLIAGKWNMAKNGTYRRCF